MSMRILHSFALDFFERLMYESGHLALINGYKTLGVRELLTACTLSLGDANHGELAKVRCL